MNNNTLYIMNRHFRWLIIVLYLCLTACNSNDGEQPNIADDKNETQLFKWRMVTTWPANFPIFQEAAEQFAADVKIISNGRLHIQVHAGNELVPPLQVFDAVSQGSIEMGHGSAYYWAGKVPEAQFFSSVPFGMTAKGMNAWLYNGGGLDLWREAYAPFNVVPIPMGNTGVQMGGWFRKKIDSLDDLKGLRMRIPGLGGKVLKRAGGNPILLAGSEVYTALERGVIDATEWVAPFHDMRLGLDRTARYYYFPGWHEPGTEFELIINSKAWAQLPEDLQLIVETVATSISQKLYSQMEFYNQRALKELRTNKNVEILPFPADVLAELRDLTEETLNEEAAKNPKFQTVYKAYKEFREDYADWNAISDNAFQKTLE